MLILLRKYLKLGRQMYVFIGITLLENVLFLNNELKCQGDWLHLSEY